MYLEKGTFFQVFKLLHFAISKSVERKAQTKIKKRNLPTLVSTASAAIVLHLEKQKAFTHTSSLSYEAHLCGHPNETL